MALSAGLGRAGFTPRRIETRARVHIEKVEGGFGVTRIELQTDAEVPGIDEATFRQQAEATKTGCPISKALASVPIALEAKLRG
jgi:osmotically inducible protein OsmC